MRPRRDGVRHPLSFESKPDVPQGVRRGVKEILQAERLVDALPPGAVPTARIIGPLAPDTVVQSAYPGWTAIGVEHAHALPGFTRQPATMVVPANSWLVEVECVERRTGGMGSHYGFEGLFVALLVALDEGRIWDVRADVAT